MYDTIIVGGGISGLYCAIHLVNVLVLEETNSWGGKIKKHYHPNYEGAGRFHKKHKLLWNLIQQFQLTPQLTRTFTEKEYETLSVEEYILKRIQTLHKPFYDKCVEVLGESDAIDFVYAQGYHEMSLLDAYDSLHSFAPDECQEYYVLKEGLSELCRRMVKAVKGTCTLNHRVKTITHLEGHVKVDGYEGKRVIVTIPPFLFQAFPLLSPYASISLGPPLLRIYAKYHTCWFETIDYKHLVPMHDGILVMVYVKEDILKFTYEGKLKMESEIRILLAHELAILFPWLNIPCPLWIKPYLWLGIHEWLPTHLSAPELGPVLLCGEAFSTRPRWIEGALESAETTLCTINQRK